MRNSCGGFVVETTSCRTSPGCERQVNGVGVAVGGIGLGVKVTVAVEVGRAGVGVGKTSGEAEQAEGPARSAMQAVMIIA